MLIVAGSLSNGKHILASTAKASLLSHHSSWASPKSSTWESQAASQEKIHSFGGTHTKSQQTATRNQSGVKDGSSKYKSTSKPTLSDLLAKTSLKADTKPKKTLTSRGKGKDFEEKGSPGSYPSIKFPQQCPQKDQCAEYILTKRAVCTICNQAASHKGRQFSLTTASEADYLGALGTSYSGHRVHGKRRQA